MKDNLFIPDIWEETIYSKYAQFNLYPYDSVVSFIYKNYPRDKEKSQIKLLELGCGSGNNLWFAAREGFDVTGIDGSETAIEYAKNRFLEEQLKGFLIVGDFTSLPFLSNEFDFVIDRCSIVCVNFEGAKKTLKEASRVLKSGGLFFLNVYSDRHSSYMTSKLLENGFSTDIKDGTLTGVGELCFYGKKDLDKLIDNEWIIKSIKHKSIDEIKDAALLIHAEWEIILQKAK
jgi:ubiquinone/menaquinone biosynthesis C-methylase UbiE